VVSVPYLSLAARRSVVEKGELPKASKEHHRFVIERGMGSEEKV